MSVSLLLKRANVLVFGTFKMAGAMELGPLDEKWATLVDTGFPTSVVEGLSFTIGDLCNQIQQNKLWFNNHFS